MSIEWFGDSPDESQELPWLRDYLKDGFDASEPVPVERIYQCPTGFLVFTLNWKGFVFKKSRLYEDLSEALPVYAKSEELLPVLMIAGNSSGKISMGIDKARRSSVWSNKGSDFIQAWEEDLESSLLKTRSHSNPLLPSPQSINGKAPKKSQSASQPKKSSQ